LIHASSSFRSRGRGHRLHADGWSVRISFGNSYVNGGPNANTQTGTASRSVCLNAPKRLTVHMTRNVERQDFGFDHSETCVNGALVATGGSVGEGLGCAMTTVNADGSIDLPAGDHLIKLYTSTNDPLDHVGAYREFNFNWELI
jgi:hypothetical protein